MKSEQQDMERKRITYGVPGMIESQMVLAFGRGTLQVNFTDGNATAYGVNPATFTTDSPVYQAVIENSAEFRKGRIIKVREVSLGDDGVSEPAATAETSGETAAAETASEETAAASEETAAASEEAAETSEEAVTEMEFANSDEAKDWLEKKYGAQRAKLRTRADIVAFGEARGVKITFEGQ